jgi:hypothetical protein
MGAVGAKDWMRVAKELTPLAEKAFPQITNIIGQDGKKLEGEFLLLNNAYADIKNAIGGEVKDIAGTVQQYSKNLNLSNALKAIAGGAQGEELLSALGSGADIMSSPTLRNLFLSESTGNAAGMLPGLSQILAGVMQSDTHSKANIPDAETFADFGAMALGTQTTSNTLDSLQLRGLFERAEQFARNNLSFAIPAALSPERQECYAREIMQCTGIGGANCNPPKYFHAATNTCKDPCADDEERNTETGDCVKKKIQLPLPRGMGISRAIRAAKRAVRAERVPARGVRAEQRRAAERRAAPTRAAERIPAVAPPPAGVHLALEARRQERKRETTFFNNLTTKTRRTLARPAISAIRLANSASQMFQAKPLKT